MPPQNNQPNQAGDPNSLPTPVDPNPQPPAHPQAPSQAPLPADQIPAAVPPLHPAHINQDFPAPDAPKPEENRYAFFMESKAKEKKTLLPKKSNKFAWIIIGGALVVFVLIVLAVVLSSVRNSQQQGNSATFVGIINQQQEIIRVNNLAAKNVKSSSLANYIATSTVATTSSQQELIAYVSKHGIKLDTKKLSKTKADPNTDKVLTAALAASVYDTSFRRVMLEMMSEYKSSLKQLDTLVTSSSEKKLVDKNLAQAELLQTMLAAE